MSIHGSRSVDLKTNLKRATVLPTNLGTLAGPRSLLPTRYWGPHPPTHRHTRHHRPGTEVLAVAALLFRCACVALPQRA